MVVSELVARMIWCARHLEIQVTEQGPLSSMFYNIYVIF